MNATNKSNDLSPIAVELPFGTALRGVCLGQVDENRARRRGLRYSHRGLAIRTTATTALATAVVAAITATKLIKTALA